MHLQVLHETRYAYTPSVVTAQHMAHLRPRDDGPQRLVSHTLQVLPAPSQQSEVRDVYGNVRTFFSLQSAHDTLLVSARSVVHTAPPPGLPPGSDPDGPPWEAVRERFRYRAGLASEAASEFAFASPYAPRHDDFDRYARPSFPPGRPLLAAAHDLMRRIHADVAYESDSTDIGTPAVEALAQRRGVCQDLAHIMLACLRAMGLPARYVSGYLLTRPPPGRPRLVGADASHAWVSVFVPAVSKGGGQGDRDGRGSIAVGADAGCWIDLDPTNDRAAGDGYVTLAWGRDFADVSPLRGVLHGGANHTLDVAVTVAPLDEAAA